MVQGNINISRNIGIVQCMVCAAMELPAFLCDSLTLPSPISNVVLLWSYFFFTGYVLRVIYSMPLVRIGSMVEVTLLDQYVQCTVLPEASARDFG